MFIFYGPRICIAVVGCPKNTGPWKGRLKRYFVNLKAVELAKKRYQSVEDVKKNKQFLSNAQGRVSKI